MFKPSRTLAAGLHGRKNAERSFLDSFAWSSRFICRAHCGLTLGPKPSRPRGGAGYKPSYKAPRAIYHPAVAEWLQALEHP